jgi:hypothetical protein
MMIRYQSGRTVEAVLLAASSDRMRVAMGARSDTVELSLLDGLWYAEPGASIEIEALIPIPGTNG